MPHLSIAPPPSSPLRFKAYFPAFTGVRALAAYLVFLHHFNPFVNMAGWDKAQAWVTEFHVGVPIFFVLSGFLITLRYADSNFSRIQFWFQYLCARFARIYPLYLLVLLATYAALWRANHFSVRDFLLSVSLTQGLFEQVKYIGISQAWSLTTEECFYLMAPVSFWLLRRQVPLWIQPLVLLLLGVGLVAILSLKANLWLGLLGSLQFMLLFTLFGYGFTFFTGMQLAKWHKQNLLPCSSRTGLITFIGTSSFVIVLAGLVAMKGGRAHGFESWQGILLYNIALPITIAIFFCGLLTESTWLRKMLGSWWVEVLGKSSYAFYLIHFGVIHDWLALHLTPHNGILFVVLNLLAIGLHYGIEAPLYRYFLSVRQSSD